MKYEYNKEMHIVDFHGLKIMKLVNHPYLAVSSGGSLVSYYLQPRCTDNEHVQVWVTTDKYGTECSKIADISLQGTDWKDTLIKYNKDGEKIE